MAAERPEIRALTGIRGFAALWVVLFHLEWDGLYEAFPSLVAIRPLGRNGFLGVDLFFILSGFILTWNYVDALATWRPREHVRFELVRLARIYPVHIATLAVIVAGVGLAKLTHTAGPWHGALYPPAALPQHVVLAQAWFPGVATWNAPSWTISAEWAAYLAFPLLCPLVARIRSANARIADLFALLCALAALALMVATIYALRALGFGESLSTYNPGGLIRIAGEFGAGCLVCRAFLIAGDRAAVWSWLTLPCVAAIFGVVAIGRADPWAMPLFAVLIASLAADRGVAARFLGTRWNLLWGRVSYSVYMTHGLVLAVAACWQGRGDFTPDMSFARRILWIAVAGAAMALTALATWRFVEEPGRRAVRRWTTPRPQSPSAPR